MENGEAEENGRPKKEYELTEQGRHIFEAEVARLESIVTMALVVLARPLNQFDGQAPLNILQAILYGVMLIPVTAVWAPLDISQAILYGTMLILVTAGLQWLLLRRYLENAAVWIPLTAVGWLAGILLILLVRPLIEGALNEWLSAFAPPLLGALVGLAQWLYLRRMVDHAGYWVLASTIGYGLLARGAFGSFISIPDFNFVILDILFAILNILFVILAPFAITGLALYGLEGAEAAADVTATLRGAVPNKYPDNA